MTLTRHPGGLARLAACAAALLAASGAGASALDPATGRLVPDVAGTVTIGFEDPAQLASLGVALTKYQKTGGWGGGRLAFLVDGGPAMTAADLAAHAAPGPALEGTAAFLAGAGPADGAAGVLVPFAKVAPLIATPRFAVNVWVRTTGATPTLGAVWAIGDLPAAGTFTSLTGIRTGRETSDGWAEYTTGPIDASIWGVPLAQVTVGLGSSDRNRNPDATLIIDALEFVPIDAPGVPPAACTLATRQAACGDDGDCQLGHCLPAYASWGPTPPPAHRGDFVDRWLGLARHVQGARNAAANADAMEAARPLLAAPTIGGRAFFGGMLALVNGLRNHHTSFGTPSPQGLLQPYAAGSSSSTLGACLGVGQLDLLAEGDAPPALGLLVYQAAASSLVGVPLKPGDAVTRIDGVDAVTWVLDVYRSLGAGVAADPGADLAWAAPSAAWMISHRASTVEITRCASPTACTGADRTVLTLDVAGPAWKSVEGTGQLGKADDPDLLACGVRFRDTLPPAAPTQQGDAVATGTLDDGTLALQFDGVYADFAAWQKQVAPAFATDPLPAKVLIDVRQGSGGYAENAALVAELVREESDPVGDAGFSIASWDGSATPAALLAGIAAATPSCRVKSIETYKTAPCDLVVEYYVLGDYLQQAGFLAEMTSPGTPIETFVHGGHGARVAWLQAADVSANDYLAAYAQGRPNQRVFGPGPTSGAFGTITSLPALLPGWRGGSIQMSDSVWGADAAAMAAATFRSGTGVSPDEVAAQRMSDAMLGVDTLIVRARAWLAGTDGEDGR